MKKLLFLLVIMVSITLVGCNKEEVVIKGPEGDANQETPKKTEKESKFSFEVDGEKVELETMSKELSEKVDGVKSIKLPTSMTGEEVEEGYLLKGNDELEGVNIIVTGIKTEEVYFDLEVRNVLTMLSSTPGVVANVTEMDLSQFPELKESYKTYHVVVDEEMTKHVLHTYKDGKMIRIIGYLKKESSKENYGELIRQIASTIKF